MADKKYASITAITELWAKIKAIIPTKVSELQNDSGFLSTESDPVFGASAAAGISAADISSWNNKVSDDKTWNNVSLNKQQTTDTGDSTYVPLATSTSPSSMAFTPVKKTPTANAIAKYDASSFLYSTTPSAADSSTKTATTAYVKGAIPSNVSTFNNDAGYLTLATLPVYDGSYSPTST